MLLILRRVGLVDFWVLLGAANTLLLALVAGLSARRDRRWAWLCTLFALLAVVLTAILVTHRTEGRIEQIGVAVEQVAWLAGPILYHYVRQSLGYPVTIRRAWVHFLLPAVILTVGTPLILILNFEPLRPEMLIVQQMAYTGASVMLFVGRPQPSDRSPLGFWWPACALALMVGIHLGQLVRLSPFGAQQQDAVIIVGAAGAVALLVLALLLPQQSAAKGAAYAKSAIGHQRAAIIFDEALIALRQDKLYRRFDLSLGDVAARINVSAHHLSQAISTAGKTSFSELVAQLRVDEARSLLSDPANAGVAVEPLGMEAGFRSRSAFYFAFRERLGLSPAEFRKRNPPIVSVPSGQDIEKRD